MDCVKLLFISLTLVTGTVAESCRGATTTLYCMFGCCSDSLFIYCCLSNGAGIGIIVAAIVVILSIIGYCLRRQRYQRALHSVPATGTVPQTTVVTNTNTGYVNPGYGHPPPANMGYGQPPPPNMGYGQPPPPPNMGYGQPPPPNMGYGQPPPPNTGFEPPPPYK